MQENKILENQNGVFFNINGNFKFVPLETEEEQQKFHELLDGKYTFVKMQEVKNLDELLKVEKYQAISLDTIKCTNNKLLKIFTKPLTEYTVQIKKDFFYTMRMNTNESLDSFDQLIMNIIFTYISKGKTFVTVSNIVNHLKPQNSKRKSSLYADVEKSIEKLLRVRMQLTSNAKIDNCIINKPNAPLLRMDKTLVRFRGQQVEGYEIIIGANTTEQLKNLIFLKVSEEINQFIYLYSNVFRESPLKFTRENIALYTRLYTRVKQIQSSLKNMSNKIRYESIEPKFAELSTKEKKTFRKNFELILNKLVELKELESFQLYKKGRFYDGAIVNIISEKK